MIVSANRRAGDEGFTLIELMVVVLIIAILIAIAIPTFFGARQRANDRAAQSNVRNAFTATRVYYTDKLSYSAVPADMLAIEPSLLWTNTPLSASSPTNSVYLGVYDVPYTGQTVVVATRAPGGRCFFLKDVMAGATEGTFFAKDVSGGATCAPPDPSDPGWGNSWG